MPVHDDHIEQQVGRQGAIAAIVHVGPLAFLVAIVGGIAGWLLSAGALPRPGFFPLPPGAPLQATLLFAALGLLGGGILGGIAHLADRTQAGQTPPTPAPEQD